MFDDCWIVGEYAMVKDSEINIDDYTSRGRNHFSIRFVDFIDDLIRERLDIVLDDKGGD